jgi:hypothetical protein
MAIFFADLFADLSGARDRPKVSRFKLYSVAKVELNFFNSGIAFEQAKHYRLKLYK